MENGVCRNREVEEDEGSQGSLEFEFENEDDEITWRNFVRDHVTGKEIHVSDSDSESSNDGAKAPGRKTSASSSDDTSSDSDSSGDGDSDGDNLIPTYPMNMNSDSESEQLASEEQEAKLLWSIPGTYGVPETELITIGDDDDDDLLSTSNMRCSKCPEGQSLYKDKTLFLIHRERHVGRNHFVCPSCLKPFIKISYCLSHEIRVHDKTFALQNPLLMQAHEYREAKKAKEVRQKEENAAGSVPNSHLNCDTNNIDNPPQSPQCSSKSTQSTLTAGPDVSMSQSNSAQGHSDGEVVVQNNILLPFEFEEFEIETDEDDPKFYPDHAVPSTALYPYRGPPVHYMFNSYEIHLKYGRKKRTAINTISRCVLAHRRQLVDEGRIPESEIGKGQFYKPPNPVAKEKKKRVEGHNSDSSSQTVSSKGGKNNRPANLHGAENDNSSDASGTQPVPVPAKQPRRKKRKVEAISDRTYKMSYKTFASGLIIRVCQLCQFIWSSEVELRAHRDEKHPKKTIQDLMPIIKKKVRKKVRDSDLDDDDWLFEKVEPKQKPKPRPKIRSTTTATAATATTSGSGGSYKLNQIDEPVDHTPQEAFLSTLGLISFKQLSLQKPKRKLPRMRICTVKMTKISRKRISRSGRAFLCSKCEFVHKSRDLVAVHFRTEHRNEAKYNFVL